MLQIENMKYFAPKSLDEALQILADEADSVIYAGGTDFMVKYSVERLVNAALVSIRNLSGLKTILHTDEEICIGAGVTLAEIEKNLLLQEMLPVLPIAASQMASSQVRNIATIGGNLCNAAPSADLAPPLLVLDAEVTLESKAGSRRETLVDFFTGPGQSIRRKDEMMTAIHIPVSAKSRTSLYCKSARRKEMDIATVNVALSGYMENGTLTDCFLVYGAVGPTPFRARELENLLIGEKISKDLIRHVAGKVADVIKPISNIRATAEYRRNLASVYTERLLMQIAGLSECS